MCVTDSDRESGGTESNCGSSNEGRSSCGDSDSRSNGPGVSSGTPEGTNNFAIRLKAHLVDVVLCIFRLIPLSSNRCVKIVLTCSTRSSEGLRESDLQSILKLVQSCGSRSISVSWRNNSSSRVYSTSHLSDRDPVQN
jgi:hypothetical protein